MVWAWDIGYAGAGGSKSSHSETKEVTSSPLTQDDILEMKELGMF